MPGSLAGKRVVVTRAAHQSAELRALLEARGAQALDYPSIQIAPPADLAPLDEALRNLSQGAYDGLVLTSVNAVYALCQRLPALGLGAGIFQGLWVACIGPATAEVAQKTLGMNINLIPDEYVAEGLLAAIRLSPDFGASQKRILLPRAEVARPVLVDGLEQAGARLTVVPAYRALPASGGVELPALVKNRGVDAVTLTSSSTARFFVQRFIAEGGCLDDLSGVCVACIGPVTAETVIHAGLAAQVTARRYTIPGLATALEDYFRGKD